MSRLIFSGSIFALLTACGGGEKPTLTTTVVDPWGNGVAGATLAVAGSDATHTTNDQGQVVLPLMAQEYAFTVSGEGLIDATKNVSFEKAEGKQTASIDVVPVPKKAGYHVIGEAGYAAVGSQVVRTVGNDLMSHYGIDSAGETLPKADTIRVVYNTPLPKDELARLDLELHKLTFLEEMDLKTAEGNEKVEVDMWVSAGPITFDRAQLGGSDDNYLFSLNGLEPGAYAFVTQGLLRPATADAFAANPSKKVHAFRVE